VPRRSAIATAGRRRVGQVRPRSTWGKRYEQGLVEKFELEVEGEGAVVRGGAGRVSEEDVIIGED
jgi:hypothetical protein